jgi:hypothetical protein
MKYYGCLNKKILARIFLYSNYNISKYEFLGSSGYDPIYLLIIIKMKNCHEKEILNMA